MTLPQLVAVTGKKRSGKGFFCERLRYGPARYTHVHIAEFWLRQWYLDHGLDPDTIETTKAHYRKEIQHDAMNAREKDPLVLVAPLIDFLGQMARASHQMRVVVDGVRFLNEVSELRACGACVVKIETPNYIRRARFVAAGEDPQLMADSFESEIDLILPDIILPGHAAAGAIVPLFEVYASHWEEYRIQSAIERRRAWLGLMTEQEKAKLLHGQWSSNETGTP